MTLMTIVKKTSIAGTIAFLGLALFSFAPASASEVTGTLSAGTSSSTGGSSVGGTINGGVGGSTITGTVSGGGSSGGGGGGGGGTILNSTNGSVLGSSIAQAVPPSGLVLGSSIAQAETPAFPSTGFYPSANVNLLSVIATVFVTMALLLLLVTRGVKNARF